MKKIVTTFAFLIFSFVAYAQQDNLDQLQQEPPRETQAQLERSAARDAQKNEAERKQKEAETEKTKAQAQNDAARKEAELKANKEKEDKDKSKKK